MNFTESTTFTITLIRLLTLCIFLICSTFFFTTTFHPGFKSNKDLEKDSVVQHTVHNNMNNQLDSVKPSQHKSDDLNNDSKVQIYNLETKLIQKNTLITQYEDAIKKWKLYELQVNAENKKNIESINQLNLKINSLSIINNEISTLKNENRLINDKLENPHKYLGYGGMKWSIEQINNFNQNLKDNNEKLSILYSKIN